MRDALPSFREELRVIGTSAEARRMLDLERMTRLAGSLPAGGFETALVANAWGQALPRGIAYGYFLRKWQP